MVVGQEAGYSRTIVAGPFSAEIDGDRIHSVRWFGLDVLRSVSAPLRDQNWGTLPEVETDRAVSGQNGISSFRRSYRLRDSNCEGSLIASFDPAGTLTIEWSLHANEEMSVNRAGLCVLHPLTGVEGTPLRITRPDGEQVLTEFPDVIAAAQPAKNIAALHHEIDGVSVTMEFEGEIFEMEDQRNWSDASYKTYCRPLSSPAPFRIARNESLDQRITIRLKGRPGAGSGAGSRSSYVRMPEILLAVEPGWQGPVPAGCGRLARFGQEDWSEGELSQLGDAAFDAEFVVPADEDPRRFLGQWAQRMDHAGLQPRHVIALPEAYLKSYQPDGDW